MRVITLRQQEFEERCASLANLVASDGPYDLVIGIATGGVVVANTVARMLEGNPRVVAVHLQRPSTQRKGKLFKSIVRLLPRFILDRLRIIESVMLSGRAKQSKVLPDINMPAGVSEARRILIMDDAIDSGLTMAAVAEGVKRCNPAAQVVTGVITVTTQNPVFYPDYTLYADRTLIRFPWSADA